MNIENYWPPVVSDLVSRDLALRKKILEIVQALDLSEGARMDIARTCYSAIIDYNYNYDYNSVEDRVYAEIEGRESNGFYATEEI